MVDLVSVYENYLLNIKHASANTVASYMRDIRQFSSYVSEMEDSSISDCDRDCICRYTQHLMNNGKSPATVARCVASLKSFYSFCVSESLVKENPVYKIPTQKAEKKLPQILTGREVELLLEQPPSLLQKKGSNLSALHYNNRSYAIHRLVVRTLTAFPEMVPSDDLCL